MRFCGYCFVLLLVFALPMSQARAEESFSDLARQARVSHEAGDHKAALNIYDRLLLKSPEDAEVHYQRGVVLEGLGQRREAMRAYKQSEKLGANFPEVYNNIAGLFIEAQNYKNAGTALKKALAIKPDFGPAQYNLGILWEKLGKLDRALAALRKAVKAKDADAVTWDRFGQVLMRQNRVTEAIRALKHALSMEPTNSEIKTDLGFAYLAKLKVDSAFHEFKEAAALDAKNARAWHGVGRVLLKKKSFSRAKISLSQALNLNKKNSDIAADLCRAHIGIDPGSVDSVTVCKRARNLGSLLGQYLLGKVLVAQGKCKAGVKVLQNFAEKKGVSSRALSSAKKLVASCKHE